MPTSSKKQQHTLKVIRRFEEDIWGVLGVKKRPTNVLHYMFEAYQNNFKYKKLLSGTGKVFFLTSKRGRFLYKVSTEDKEFKRKRRSLKINNYLNLLKLRRFYGGLRLKKFIKRFKKLKLPSNMAAVSFAYFLESRLDVVLYRSNMFQSIYSARQYISHNKVFVNGRKVNRPGYVLSVEDVVTVLDPERLYVNLSERLADKQILCNFPAYMEVNYKLGAVILSRLPRIEEIPYPFFIDISTLTNSFSK